MDSEAFKRKSDINLHKIGKKNEQLHELLFGYKPIYTNKEEKQHVRALSQEIIRDNRINDDSKTTDNVNLKPIFESTFKNTGKLR